MSDAKQMVALHVAEPKIGDEQTVNETHYKGYERVPLDGREHLMFAHCTEPVTVNGHGFHNGPPSPPDIVATRITHASIGEDGKVVAVIALKPPAMLQKDAGPVLVVNDGAIVE